MALLHLSHKVWLAVSPQLFGLVGGKLLQILKIEIKVEF
jgi:hypothetical protein